VPDVVGLLVPVAVIVPEPVVMLVETTVKFTLLLLNVVPAVGVTLTPETVNVYVAGSKVNCGAV
jgi:hypothetical protein